MGPGLKYLALSVCLYCSQRKLAGLKYLILLNENSFSISANPEKY